MLGRHSSDPCQGKGMRQRANSLNQGEIREGERAEARRTRAHSLGRINLGGLQTGGPKPVLGRETGGLKAN